MSGRRLKQLLLQSAELDDLVSTANTPSAKKPLVRKKKENGISRVKNNENDDNDMKRDEKEVKLKSQLKSILFFDHAFSQRTGSTDKSMKRKMSELSNESNQRKKIKSKEGFVGSSSNSRSSSSFNSRRTREPTFNKKKDAEKKRIKSVTDLARQLRKRNTKKIKKKKKVV